MNKPSITFVMSYHNNLFDMIRTLQSIADIKVLSFRPIKKKTYVRNGVSITNIRFWAPWPLRFGIYSIRHMWELMSSHTDYIVLKHLHLFRNTVPWLFARLRGSKVIFMVQQVHTDNFLLATLTRIASAIISRTDARVFAVTKEGYTAIKNYIPNAAYIPACIDPNRFLKKDYTLLKPKILKIACITKYQRRKNIPVLVKALKTLKKIYPDITFLLTIIGPIADAEAFKSIALLVRNFSLENHVTILKEVAHMEIPKHLANADLFILPASREPLGYSVLEAMATGLPVLVSDEVGAKSSIEHGENGYLFAPRQPDAIVTAVSEFITPEGEVNMEKIAHFGTKNQELIAAHHTPDVCLPKFTQLLEA